MSALLDRLRAQNGPKPLGRRPNPRRVYYMCKFGVTRKTLMHLSLDQLDACASDCARRLLLGVGEQFASADAPTVKPVGVSRAIAQRVRRAA